MTSTAMKSAAAGAVLVLATGLFSSTTSAQQVFRIVGPDGKVTFSDTPPPPAANARVTTGSGGSGRAPAGAGLPFELRKVASQYPVTLYSGDNCGPCGSARALLSSRGIPFSEKTVKTFEDSEALKRLSGESSLPFLTIGSQQLKGFSDAEWTQFLDAAGYPKTSVLPASYRQAAATPLVTVSAPPAAAAPAAPQAAADTVAAQPSAAPAGPSADNPAGIRF